MPPMAAPLPAPLPPPAMAPPAAPRTAPATAPIPASLAVSTVLSRCPDSAAACWLHASMAACVGAAGAREGAGAGEAAGGAEAAGGVAVVIGAGGAGGAAGSVAPDTLRAGLELTSAGVLSASFPLQLPTTRVVVSAVAPTRI